MRKTYFISLVLFMIFSLAGIILIQGYWIYTSINTHEQEFSMAVRQSLASVAEDIQERELRHYLNKYKEIRDSIGQPQNSQIRQVLSFTDSDNASNLSSLFTFGILEEEYNIPISANEKGGTSTVFDLKGIETRTIFKEAFDPENNRVFSTETYKDESPIELVDKVTYQSFFSKIANTFPVHKRLNAFELQLLINRELNQRNVVTPFEFGVYSDGLATKVSSNNYAETQKGPQYSVPIFIDNQGSSQYELIVSFPEKDLYVRSSIIGVASLSFILTLLIIVVCAVAIYQIIKQKKISEVKSDFINNMSHEFKTPLATINLAIDAIENPQNIKDEKKISRYLNMMREENKRMKDQVDTVLMISQLERGSTPMEWELIDPQDAIQGAVNHVSLIIQNRQGAIHTDFQAAPCALRADKNHFTNMITNLLDNAIKYSEGAPQIALKTAVVDGQYTIKISDKGMGMDQETLKLIFQKFYRVQSGNIHNIKGHGLGLSYVKKILELLNGTIHVRSTLGEGSEFTIQLPLES